MFPKTSLILASVLAAAGFASGYAIDNAACWRYYKVKPGDTCISIAKANQVPTYQLFTANPGVINPQCSNLRPGELICLGNAGHLCPRVYNLVSGDTCSRITARVGISLKQLYAQNPNINPGCTNLQVDEVLCVAKPSRFVTEFDTEMYNSGGCNGDYN